MTFYRRSTSFVSPVNASIFWIACDRLSFSPKSTHRRKRIDYPPFDLGYQPILSATPSFNLTYDRSVSQIAYNRSPFCSGKNLGYVQICAGFPAHEDDSHASFRVRFCRRLIAESKHGTLKWGMWCKWWWWNYSLNVLVLCQTIFLLLHTSNASRKLQRVMQGSKTSARAV